MNNKSVYFQYLIMAGFLVFFFGIVMLRVPGGAVIFIPIVSYLVINFLFQMFPKVGGTILGLIIITLLAFQVFNPDNPIAIAIRSTKLVSVTGLWLTGTAIVGKARLEKWDEFMRNFSKGSSQDKIAMNYQRILGEKIMPWGFLLSFGLIFICMLAGGIPLIFSENGMPLPKWVNTLTLNIVMIDMGVFVVIASIFLILVVFSPFIIYTILLPIQILRVPYHLISMVENQSSLERTLLFIGMVLGTVGLIFGI